MLKLEKYFPNLSSSIVWMLEKISQVVRDKEEVVLKISFKNGGIRNITPIPGAEYPPKK
jgi:hypothetical protein